MHVTTLFKEQAAQILQVDYNLTLINYKEEGFKTFVRAFYYYKYLIKTLKIIKPDLNIYILDFKKPCQK